VNYISGPTKINGENVRGSSSFVTSLPPLWVPKGNPSDLLLPRTAFSGALQEAQMSFMRCMHYLNYILYQLHLVSAEILVIETLEPASQLLGRSFRHAGRKLGDTNHFFTDVNRAVGAEREGQRV
jgi:hypothetical protein